ncbi:hypothetical protein MMC07_000968 [Pseudocyphellaria aurata]|nr:hypothetical protein [Pseudocyphellaria aurata]
MASNDMASELEKGSPSSSYRTWTGKSSKTVNTDGTPSESVQTLSSVKRGILAMLHSFNLVHLRWTRNGDPAMQRHGRMSPTKIRKLEDFPTGFPKLACFLNSDDAFMVYRRFGSIYSRLILRKQDEMSRIEALLQGMDKTDEADGHVEYLMSHTVDEHRECIPAAWPESRTELMNRLEKKALDYAELLLKTHQLKSLSQPSSREYRNVLHFMENSGGQLTEEESAFIYEKEDLITLRPGREHAWLDDIIEKTLKIFRCRLLRFFFCSKETRAKTNDPNIHYYDRTRISVCATTIIMTIILVLLIIPIWLLYRLSIMGSLVTSPDSIVVILIFTLLFSVVLSAFTKAKRHEILAASAG